MSSKKSSGSSRPGVQTRKGNKDRHPGRVDLPGSQDSPQEHAAYKARTRQNETKEEKVKRLKMEKRIAVAEQAAQDARAELEAFEKQSLDIRKSSERIDLMNDERAAAVAIRGASIVQALNL